MWFVRVALRHPYTFIVLAILIPLLGAVTLFGTPGRPGMPTDIFPDIRIPVISISYRYTGIPPDEMAGRFTSQVERYLTTTVNDIEHVESQSYFGINVIKVFFQPGVDINLAMAQVASFAQTALAQLPEGATAPFILKYNASSVPIIQLALSSNRLSEAAIFDFANQFVRSQIGTIAGTSIPFPYGGAMRQVQVDLRPDALRARGLSATDVSVAIGNQNLILPAGTQKIGDTEYSVKLNASPASLDELNDLPIASEGGVVTYLRDVAQVHDGHPPQTNIVRVNGHRAVLMSILKTGSASTLEIVNTIKERLPLLRNLLPEGVSIDATGDQSVFVKAAVHGVMLEGLIAATLTALMILLFLGSWRSTLIITISIPLSILTSIILLNVLGETINLMTLGGLALAVGILVDDATVTIENINRHLEEGTDVETAILEGSRQILVPALVSVLAICIVFIPMFLLSGVARYLFVPMAEAVVFAMLTSYALSRTLVPTLAKYWLRTRAEEAAAAERHGAWRRFQLRFETRFAALRERYRLGLDSALHRSGALIAGFLGFVLISMALYPFLGQNFFPDVDSGQIRLHIRAPSGMRVEQTARLVDRIEASIREVIPAGEIASIVDNIGIPSSGINLAYGTSGVIGTGDADIQVALTPNHAPTAGHVRRLRERLPAQFPSTTFSFLPADIVSQILNFGLPAPIDIQVIGVSPDNRDVANRLLESLRRIPGLVDLRIQQTFNHPELQVVADRSRARQLGLSQRDIASNLLLTLSGSGNLSPTFWLNPETGLQYPIVAQTPQYRMDSLSDLLNVPVSAPGQTQILGGLATVNRAFGQGIVTHFNSQPVIDIFGAVQGRDLGAIARDVRTVLAAEQANLPKGTQLVVRGQMQTMTESYTSLAVGLIGAIVLVYLLIVVNFQSWLDPFIIITALPAALAGIAWMLFGTGTTLSVPALTGAIMCMGVATANSILLVSFARDRMNEGTGAIEAALDAGFTRFRPVLMTALAMIIGMLPMALGVGEGGEQNAPLGRAVIGGLVFATVATLFFVPTVFAVLHGRRRPAERALAQTL
jgi:CzcA family heavy metal efflux pump